MTCQFCGDSESPAKVQLSVAVGDRYDGTVMKVEVFCSMFCYTNWAKNQLSKKKLK